MGGRRGSWRGDGCICRWEFLFCVLFVSFPLYIRVSVLILELLCVDFRSLVLRVLVPEKVCLVSALRILERFSLSCVILGFGAVCILSFVSFLLFVGYI